MRLVSAVLTSLAVVSSELPPLYPSVPVRGVSGTVRMPLIGIGTWQYNNSVAEQAVADAFSLGYRHVDTALVYGNQVGVGQALVKAGVDRKDFFITTKVPGSNGTAAKAALAQSLTELGVDYVDLMLIHWPASTAAERKEEWEALEEFAKAGHALAIGVSHYCKTHVQEVLSYATLPIAVNQNQYHVGMNKDTQKQLHDKAFMEQHGILFEAYSSLCGPCTPPDNMALINGPLVTEIGNKHNKSGSQVALRWVVQQGIPVIPKSSNPKHILSNFQLFDFKLDLDDMARLNSATSPAETGTPQHPDDAQDCAFEPAF